MNEQVLDAIHRLVELSQDLGINNTTDVKNNIIRVIDAPPLNNYSATYNISGLLDRLVSLNDLDAIHNFVKLIQDLGINITTYDKNNIIRVIDAPPLNNNIATDKIIELLNNLDSLNVLDAIHTLVELIQDKDINITTDDINYFITNDNNGLHLNNYSATAQIIDLLNVLDEIHTLVELIQDIGVNITTDDKKKFITDINDLYLNNSDTYKNIDLVAIRTSVDLIQDKGINITTYDIKTINDLYLNNNIFRDKIIELIKNTLLNEAPKQTNTKFSFGIMPNKDKYTTNTSFAIGRKWASRITPEIPKKQFKTQNMNNGSGGRLLKLKRQAALGDATITKN